MSQRFEPETKFRLKYDHVNRYHVWIGTDPAITIETPHSSGAITEKTLAEFFEKVAPEYIAYAAHIWRNWTKGIKPPIWEFTFTWVNVLDAVEKAKPDVEVPDWHLRNDGLLGAPKFLIERAFGEERLGRFTTDDSFIYVGYDDRDTLLWIVWARRNGTTFNDLASKALLSVAKPGGHWEGGARTVVADARGHVPIGAGDNDVAFVHYDKAGDDKVEDGFYGSQTTGRHRLIAYRRDFPFDPNASYSWMM